MSVNQNIYPYNTQVRRLPIYLTGIGGSEFQGHICRPEGYFWHQILYSAKGDGFLKYDNLTIHLSEGWFFFLPIGYPHEYYPAEGSWDVRWTAFDGYACPQLLKELNLTKPVAVKLENAAELESIYNKIFVAQKTDRIYGDYTCSGLIYQYLLEFHQRVLDKNKMGGGDRSSLLMPVINYMEKNFHRDFPMTELSQIAGISPQHLCRVFRETMHMRPKEYLIRCRLTEATRLLRQTELPIAKIGLQVGFLDARYFSTVFRRYEGISPAEFRKRYRSMSK